MTFWISAMTCRREESTAKKVPCQNTLNRWFRIFKKHGRTSRQSVALLPRTMKVKCGKGCRAFKEFSCGVFAKINTSWCKGVIKMHWLYMDKCSLAWEEHWDTHTQKSGRDLQSFPDLSGLSLCFWEIEAADQCHHLWLFLFIWFCYSMPLVICDGRV